MSTDRIEKSVLLRASRERVWRAVSDAGEFGTWFGVKFEGQFAPGAQMRGVIAPSHVNPAQDKAQQPYANLPFEIVIEEIKPQTLFSFRWHPYAVDPQKDFSAEPSTLVVFELKDAEGGILLKITESGFDKIPLDRRAKAFSANESGWAMQAETIAIYLKQ
jgi:uncharacterized protein YndB with AHSA1/START domain